MVKVKKYLDMNMICCRAEEMWENLHIIHPSLMVCTVSIMYIKQYILKHETPKLRHVYA